MHKVIVKRMHVSFCLQRCKLIAFEKKGKNGFNLSRCLLLSYP